MDKIFVGEVNVMPLAIDQNEEFRTSLVEMVEVTYRFTPIKQPTLNKKRKAHNIRSWKNIVNTFYP